MALRFKDTFTVKIEIGDDFGFVEFKKPPKNFDFKKAWSEDDEKGYESFVISQIVSIKDLFLPDGSELTPEKLKTENLPHDIMPYILWGWSACFNNSIDGEALKKKLKAID